MTTSAKNRYLRRCHRQARKKGSKLSLRAWSRLQLPLDGLPADRLAAAATRWLEAKQAG